MSSRVTQFRRPTHRRNRSLQRIRQFALLSAWLLIFAHSVKSAAAEAVSLPAESRILDPDLLMYGWPRPVISPDGNWIAYVSRGFICAANVADGTHRRLVEVPNTWTHVLTLPQYAPANGADNAMTRPMSREERDNFHALSMHQVFSLQWTHDSSAVAYGVSFHDGKRRISQFDFWIVPLDGEPTQLAHFEHEIGDYSAGDSFSRDRKFIVANARHPRPLIWDVAAKGPRATPYLAIIPSPSSDHWLAVEKDTRQLVRLDAQFAVAERYEEFVPYHYTGGMALHWSPDERFMIWRIQIGFDHYNNWEGCRLDLKTKQRRILTGDYWEELLQFTGRGGEFLHVRAHFNKGVRGTRAARFLVSDLVVGKEGHARSRSRYRSPRLTTSHLLVA
jgi:hypothetical protein